MTTDSADKTDTKYSRLVRPAVLALQPYAWEQSSSDIAKKYGLPEGAIIRFDQNTLAPKPIRLPSFELSDYPTPSYEELVNALSRYSGAKPNQVLVGAGADEIIDDIMKTFIDPGDVVVVSTPTYSMYKVCASIAGGRTVEVPRDQNFAVDIDALLLAARKEKAKIIFLCNPNNPDGSLTPKKDIERLIREFASDGDRNGVVVIDEAYFEFCGETVAPLVDSCPNLIVIRTLSKAFGLAGARVGYAIACEDLTNEMNKIRPPSSISTPSVLLALEALRDPAAMRTTVEEVLTEKKRVTAELEALGFEVFPSVANFILFRCGSNADADKLCQKALERGYVLRNFSSKRGCENCLRMSIRRKEDNEKLLSLFARCPDSIIFDVDGVLVDVSRSYREAIKQTVNGISGKSIVDSDIDSIKALPNSNNDWDVTYALITGICDGAGMRAIDRRSAIYIEAKQKFQELYLGGLRDLETPITKLETLRALADRGYKLAVVTSRPRDEALYVLDRLFPGIFDPKFVVAQEDCDEEKPSPKPLLNAKQRIGCRAVVYVGDTINDALASRAAKMKFVSVVPALDADYRIKDGNEIVEVLA